MTDAIVAKLRKELESDRERYAQHLVNGGVPDYTEYKKLCAKIEEVDRLLRRITTIEREYLKEEGFIDD